MRAGLNLPQYEIDFASGEVVAPVKIARAAEEAGFDSVWVSDHPFAVAPDGARSGALEAVTTMADVAGRTARVTVGSLVLAVSMRGVAGIARAARALALVAPGRTVVGIGAGWYRAEHEAFGIPLPPYAARMEALEQAARAAKGTGAELLIGGAGRGALEVAARHAERWNCSWDVPTATFRELSRLLDDACARAGRDPASVSRSVGLTVLVGSDAERERAVGSVRARAPFLASLDLAAIEGSIVAGEPDACVERILAYDADEVVVAPFVRDDVGIVARLGEVVRALHGAGDVRRRLHGGPA